MKASPAEVVAQWLVGKGILVKPPGTKDEFPVSIFSLPPDPSNDRWVTVSDTTAVTDGRLMGTGEQVLHPGIQVRIRAERDFRDGWRKGTQIQDALATIKRDRVVMYAGTPDEETVLLHTFTLTASLVPIGQEEKNLRRSFTLNGILTLSEVS